MKKASIIAKKVLKCVFYLVLVTTFLVACVVIIFYASGYRFSWKTKKIQRTGMLSLAEPEKKARLFIDGKEIAINRQKSIIDFFGKTITITLSPGEYNVLIAKEGETSFEERVKIEPELITSIGSTILVPQTPDETKLTDIKTKIYALAPDNQKLIYAKDPQNVSLYSFDKNTVSDLKIPSTRHQDVKNFFWSPDSDKVAIVFAETKNTPSSIYIWDIVSEKNSYFLNQMIATVPKFDAVIFPDDNTNILGVAKNQIYFVDIGKRQIASLDNNMELINISDDCIYYYKTKAKQLICLKTNTRAKIALAENIEKGPDMKLYSAKPGSNNYLVNNGDLFLLSGSKEPEKLDSKVRNIFLDDSSETIFYEKGYEIWQYTVGQKEPLMTTRFSFHIQDIKNYPNSDYLFYSSNNNVGLIKKDGLHDTVIKKGDSIDKAFLMDKKNILIIEQKKDIVSISVVKI